MPAAFGSGVDRKLILSGAGSEDPIEAGRVTAWIPAADLPENAA
jgi:hypothetical protein